MAKTEDTTQTGGDAPKPETPASEVAKRDPKGRVTNTPMTKAQAARLVYRNVAKKDDKGEIVKDKDGNPVTVQRRISEDDVMSFADYGDRVVVVTTAGEKLEGAK